MIRLVSILIFTYFFIDVAEAQHIRLMTYNIRYDNPNDGDNQWNKRRDLLCNQIKFHSPDVLGTQEGLHHQLAIMDSVLSDYQYVGVGRDDGNIKGEYCAIFYRNNSVQLLKHGTFWLSERPDTVSKGWDAALPRICTWAIFVHRKSKCKFLVFNTHFDHIGDTARSMSAKLIISKMKSINTENLPVMLMGDFNLEPQSLPIQYISAILNDSKSVAGLCFGPEGTFNAFDFCKPVLERIDYIFTNKSAGKILKHAVLSDSFNCRYPSDHLPVLVDMELSK